MKANELLINLEKTESKGLQISKKNGFINSTWLIYQKKADYYYFDISDKIEFNDRFKYTKDEFLEEFQNVYFEIDCEVS